MVFVPLQVGTSLSFKGTGKGNHSKIRKKGENANKALKRLGPAKGIRLGITFHACLFTKALMGGRQSLNTTHITVLLGFIIEKEMEETGGAV